MMTQPCPSGASPDEADAFLAAHPEVEAIDIVLHDSNGIGRGKIIRRHELSALYRSGRHMPISILGLDVVGEDVHETGLIWDQGDGDLRAWPVPGSLKPLHNTSPARAEVLLSLYHLDYDKKKRRQSVEIRDALSGKLICARGGLAAGVDVDRDCGGS